MEDRRQGAQRWGRILDVATLLGVYLLALALRWPLWGVAPYGDEGMHYYLARHLLDVPADISDVEGGIWFHPSWIVFERPLFLGALHPFAIHGFEAFRVGQSLVTSLLPVSAWVVIRAYGGHRITAALAGVACAAFPALVTWGALGQMDEWMAILLAFALAARRLGHHVLAAFLFFLAVLAKETAWALLAGVALVSFWKAWWAGEAKVWPFAADRATTALLLAMALSPLPLILSLMTGLNQFGGHATGSGSRLLDLLYATPWFIPILLAGLRWRASRPLCGFALFFATAYLLSHVPGGRSVEAWYLAAPIAFCLIGVAMALDQVVRRAGTTRARRSALGASAVAISLVLVIVLLPAGATKGRWTHPFTGQADDSWRGTVRYETEFRDRPLLDAIDAMTLDGTQDVVAEDLHYAHALALTIQARHVYVDSAVVREQIPIWTDTLVQRLETNGTWLLMRPTETAMSKALAETYADCLVLDTGGYQAFATWRCQGRGQQLDAAYEDRRPQAA